MNRLVAEAFANLLGVVHLIVLVGLVAFAFSDGLPQPLEALEGVPKPPEGLPNPLAALVLAVGYLVLMGVVTTLVAINRNLERIAAAMERERTLAEA